jgi:hypothetical protein
VLLIPGTSSVRHLGENFAVSEIESGQQARNELAAAACGQGSLVGSALAPQLRRFLLERVQPYPIRLVNWFMSK